MITSQATKHNEKQLNVSNQGHDTIEVNAGDIGFEGSQEGSAIINGNNISLFTSFFWVVLMLMAGRSVCRLE